MKPVEIIVILAIALIVGAAAFYIIRAKKQGKKCIGCPYSSSCGKGGCSGSCHGCTHSCGGDSTD